MLQPLEHAGEDGDTEAAGGGARMQRGPQLNQQARRRATPNTTAASQDGATAQAGSSQKCPEEWVPPPLSA